MKSASFKSALEILQKDKINNLSMIGFIENGYAREVQIEGGSVMAKGFSDQMWVYFSSNNDDELKELQKYLNKDDKHFGAVSDSVRKIIAKDKKIDWQITALQLHLPDEVKLKKGKYGVHKLSASDAEYIINESKYKDILSVPYLEDRITRSFSAGIYQKGKLAAWGLTHDEGAIGSLNVLKEFRGKGMGSAIVASLVEQIRSAGKIPFAQVEERNIPALKLCKKLGFLVDRSVTWLKLR